MFSCDLSCDPLPTLCVRQEREDLKRQPWKSRSADLRTLTEPTQSYLKHQCSNVPLPVSSHLIASWDVNIYACDVRNRRVCSHRPEANPPHFWALPPLLGEGELEIIKLQCIRICFFSFAPYRWWWNQGTGLEWGSGIRLWPQGLAQSERLKEWAMVTMKDTYWRSGECLWIFQMRSK